MTRRLQATDRHVTAYLVGLGLAAGALLAALLLAGYGLNGLWATLALAGVAAFAERWSVKLTSRAEFEQSISLLPTLFAAAAFGPVPAMLVSATSMLGNPCRPPTRWGIYLLSRSITGAVAGLVASQSSHLLDSRLAGIALATCVAALVAEALDGIFAGITYTLRGHGGLLDPIRTIAPVVLGSVPLYAPVVAVLAYAYHEVSPWTLPLFFIPALAAQRSFILYQEQRRLAQDLSAANLQLERANLSFATALVATLDARDRYTAGHSAAVAIYAKDIAERMGLDEQHQRFAHLCGLVHDIGKIGLPPGLLEKPGALNLEERRQMEEHATIGERILANVDDYTEIARIVRHHHERVDGQGYPDGLSADAIPLISRILGVADAYDAMTSDRPYRDAMPSRVARLRLAQAVESQFDTSVVAAFEAILAGATEEYRLGTRGDFTFEVQEKTEQAA
ncbi:MAG: HD domain-containing protein [Actinobacteria bacterium]|nr:HD domain-containing protein [Actinomycetota bacterium]